MVATADSVPGGPQRFRSAPIVVTGRPALRFAVGSGEDREIESDPNPRRTPLPPALVARVAALPQVRRVVADRSFTVRSRAGTATVGRPWSMRLAAPYRLVAGRAPIAPDEVVATVGAGAFAVGRRVTLVTPAGPAAYRVAGLAAGGPRYERPLFFTDARAAQLAPRGEALAVWPRSAAPAIRARSGRAVVLTGAARGAAEPNPERDAIAGAGVLLGLMTMTVGFVAVFSISSSFAFSVALRRRELGLLRAVGATPRQIRRLVLREAALVAAAAGVAGALASLAVAPLLGRWIAGRGLAPETLDVTPAPVALPVGAGLMLVVALAGAWAAARRAARVRPAEALRDAAVDRGVMTAGRWLVGVPAV